MSAGPEYRFGPYRFDAKGRMLFRENRDLGLPPKAADTLLLLLEHAGELVEKSRLLDTVWANVVVGEGSLTRTISILRKALGGEAASRAYIATVSKRGYRFVAPLDSSAGPAPADSRVMLLVLPFESSSAKKPYDYFNDGLTEEMIAQLARLNPEQLGVIARTTSLMFKDSKRRVSEIGRELGVQFVLEGTVRRGRDQVLIAARLIKVSDETQIWAESYERKPGDLLRLQSEVATRIAREIKIKLAPGAPRIEAPREMPAEALEALLKGRHLLNQRIERTLRSGITQFEKVLHHCPDCASAWAGIAEANIMLACRGFVPAKETFRQSAEAARKAIDLDAGHGDAHGSLAHLRLHDWDWVGLDDAFRRAIALSPSLAYVYYWYGEYLMSQGKPEEAIASTSQALKLDPLSPVVRSSYGMILYMARQYDRASEMLVSGTEIAPQHFLPHMRLGLVRIQQRQFPEAIRQMKIASRLAEESTETQASLAMAYAASGDHASAARIARKLESLHGKRYVLPYNIAKIYAAGNDRTRAFDWLETAFEGGNPDLIELPTEPLLDGLRTDRHFTQLMRRVGWNV